MRWSFASQNGFGIAYKITGRHIKTLFGVELSRKQFDVTGVSIHEVSEGKSMGVFSSANFVEVLTALSNDT